MFRVSQSFMPHCTSSRIQKLKHSSQTGVSSVGALNENKDCFVPLELSSQKFSATSSAHRRASAAALSIDSADARQDFLAMWQTACDAQDSTIAINGVLFNKKEAKIILSQIALINYYKFAENMRNLAQKFFAALHQLDADSIYSLIDAISQAENNLDELEKIIYIPSLSALWFGYSTAKLLEILKDADLLFRKYSSDQHQAIGFSLFASCHDIIRTPSDLIKELANLRNKIWSWHYTYELSTHCYFIISPAHLLKTDQELGYGYTDLRSKEGRKQFSHYVLVINNAINKNTIKAGYIIINGEFYSAHYALHRLYSSAWLTYHEMAHRYMTLDRLAQQQNSEESTHSLAAIRREMLWYKPALLELAVIIDDDKAQKWWQKLDKKSKSKLFRSLSSSEQALKEQRTCLAHLITCELPSSASEREHARTSIIAVSKLMAQSKIVDKKLMNTHQNFWDFLLQICNLDTLNHLFTPKPLPRLKWALNNIDSVKAYPQSFTENAWLNKSFLCLTELVQTQESYCEKIRKFKDFCGDKALHNFLKHKKERIFLATLTQQLKDAESGARLLAYEFNAALDEPVIEERIKNIANVLSSQTFFAAYDNAACFLEPQVIELWDQLCEKYSKGLSKYWDLEQNKKSKHDPFGVHCGYADSLYVPFQRRVADYVLLWQALREDTPVYYRDAVELTYLRLKAMCSKINRMYQI